ncbi:lysophospholipid acyltransferase family protein [Aquirufa sp. ROCK2-A2]
MRFYQLIGKLPLFILYGFSTFVQYLFYYVISYRKKVIQLNLKNSFPTLSQKEINHLNFLFYGYMADLLVEFFKGSSISEKEILKRVNIVNPEVIQDFLNQNIPVVLVAGHQGNWEWAIHRLALTRNTNDIVYQKLNNPSFNEFTKNVRSRFGNVVLLEKRESVVLTKERKDIPRTICLAADQAPQKPESAYWTSFMNQETAFFTGMERFAREYNYPVVFCELIRTKRGYYQMTYSTIANTPYTDLENGAIIEEFSNHLEKAIKTYPDQYLWSHKRWKHTKPEITNIRWN